MSAQANIVAYDGAATPVQHTFVPASNGRTALADEFAAFWREVTASVPTEAQGTVETYVRKLKSGTYRVTLAVSIPVMESIGAQNAAGYTAPPKVAYVNTMQVVGYFSPRSTLADRQLVRQLVRNILDNTITSTTVSGAGVAYESFGALIVPS